MELVIKLNDETYKEVIDRTEFDTLVLGIKLIEAVQNGTVLTKGHGRLIDADELLKAIDTWDKFGVDYTNSLFRLDNFSLPYYVPYIHYADMVKSVSGAETIIEADKAESEDKE